VPKRTGKAIFEAIGEQQLPDILLEVHASTGFSEALLGHRAGSAVELLASYAVLLAYGPRSTPRASARSASEFRGMRRH